MKVYGTRGFTTMELVISLGIAGFATLILYGLKENLGKQQATFSDRLETFVDTESGRRIVFQDLKGVAPSFANLKLNDNDNRGFFDYYPDVSTARFGTKLGRRLTMELGGRTDFFILTYDNKAGPVPIVIYDPVAAYQVGATPNSPNREAKLDFVSLNQNGYLTEAPPEGLGRPGFWKNGQLLLLDTPNLIRPGGGFPNDDINFQPRSPIFLGIVKDEKLVRLTALNHLIQYGDPADRARSRGIDSVDYFLRNAPGAGGGQPLIRLKAVKLLKYSLEPSGSVSSITGSSKKAGKLVRRVYENGKFSEKFILADKVTSVTFERKSVCDPAISFAMDTN